MSAKLYQLRGGIDFSRPQYAPEPAWWADVINWHPTPYGLASGIGWAAMGAEITSAASGIVTHLTAMQISDGTTQRIAVGNKQTLRWNGSAWVEIQDANNFTATSNDPMDSTFWNDLRYIVSPITGSVNAPAQTTGAADITRVSGTGIKNSRFIREFANRLCQWGTFESGGTYNPTEFKYTGYDSATTHSALNDVMLNETGDGAAGMESIGQMLLLFKASSSPVLVTLTGDPDDPFNFDQLPGNLGLINPAAFTRASQHGVFWVGPQDIYMFNGNSFPPAVGGPMLDLIYPVSSSTRFIGGYDERRGNREAVYFLTNQAFDQHEPNPNSPEITNGYFGYDVSTNSWFRGDLGTNPPRAMGNYYVQTGERTFAAATQVGTFMSLDSTNGSTIFDMDFATTTREGKSFFRTALSNVWGGMDRQIVRRVMPIVRNRAGGTIAVDLFYANYPGQRLTPAADRQELRFDGTDEIGPYADFSQAQDGRFMQLRFQTAVDCVLEGFWMDGDVVEDAPA